MAKCPICGTSASYSKFLYEKPIAGLVDTNKSKNKNILHNIEFCEKCSTLFYPRNEEVFNEIDKLYKSHPATPRKTNFYDSYYSWFSDFTTSFVDKKRTLNICEIGSNDGTLFKYLNKNFPNSRFIGIEPSLKMAKFGKENIGEDGYWFSSYFDSKLVMDLKEIIGEVDLLITRHVFEHIPNPKIFLENIKELISEKGIVIVEMPSLELIIKEKRFENISYSHLHHVSCFGFNNLLKAYDFELIEHRFVKTDGGSNIFVFSKNNEKNNIDFEKIEQKNIELFLETNLIKKKEICNSLFSKSKKKIFGYGAGAKGQHLIHLFDLGDKIYKIFDNTKEFHHAYVPSTKIEIIPPGTLDLEKLYIFNLAPTHHEAIRENCKNCNRFFDIINDELNCL